LEGGSVRTPAQPQTHHHNELVHATLPLTFSAVINRLGQYSFQRKCVLFFIWWNNLRENIKTIGLRWSRVSFNMGIFVLRIWSSGGLVWTRLWTFGFQKRQET
jgi:hypothetical protein